MSLTSYRAAPPRARNYAFPRRVVTRQIAKGRNYEEEISEFCSVFRRPGNDLLSHTLRCSTIGAEAFNGRVRDGIGFRRFAKVTKSAQYGNKQVIDHLISRQKPADGEMRSIKPIEQLVPVSYTHCCASTPGLSTWWSSTVLKGNLVSREASRLDAFSGYPVHT